MSTTAERPARTSSSASRSTERSSAGSSTVLAHSPALRPLSKHRRLWEFAGRIVARFSGIALWRYGQDRFGGGGILLIIEDHRQKWNIVLLRWPSRRRLGLPNTHRPVSHDANDGPGGVRELGAQGSSETPTEPAAEALVISSRRVQLQMAPKHGTIGYGLADDHRVLIDDFVQTVRCPFRRDRLPFWTIQEPVLSVDAWPLSLMLGGQPAAPRLNAGTIRRAQLPFDLLGQCALKQWTNPPE